MTYDEVLAEVERLLARRIVGAKIDDCPTCLKGIHTLAKDVLDFLDGIGYDNSRAYDEHEVNKEEQREYAAALDKGWGQPK